MQSKLKKLEKIQKKFTGPKDVKIFKGKELDKKLKELGIPKVSKVTPKPQKGPTRPINPEERSGRDYRIDVNRKREPEFFKDKDPYDPKQTSGPTNIEYAKKKKLKSGRRIGSIKIPKKTKKLKVDQEPNRKKQPIDPRDLAKNLIEAGELPKGLPRKQSFKKKSGGKLRGMGKALRGGGKVMRG